MSKYHVNLPKTDFSQRANSAVREPELQRFWQEQNVYDKLLVKRDAQPKFVLHDGPPYASAPVVHMGTALNKVLKDMVVKYKAQRGFYTPFVPGYDTHGLPVENAVASKVKGGRAALSPLELRRLCATHALANVDGQEVQFKRLGVLADWPNRYVTLHKEFEAAQVRVFGELAHKSFVYKGTKPVNWCPKCETALAQADVDERDSKCGRCDTPVLLRETPQWFVNVNACMQAARAQAAAVEWVPATGETRFLSMMGDREDWCVSRQRAWGVPVPVFNCTGCGHHLMTRESVESVALVFEREGSDAWWQHDAEYFLAGRFACTQCGERSFTKETDTLDVWFDSGVTHAAVVDRLPQLRGSPCELVLEGSDQHRGWFQSLLWTSVMLHGRAPYKTVLTHGFVLDEKGEKMSKRKGNVVNPDDVVKQHGADVLRLWAASVNYQEDMRVGKQMLDRLAEDYRKLRNTARFLLGNLSDFDPATDRVPLEELRGLDAFLLHSLHELVVGFERHFDRYEFHKACQLLQKFCAVDVSSLYFDVVKDRLYTHGTSSPSRRAAQTVLEHVLQALVRLMVPVTPHLAEDVWQNMPAQVRASSAPEESVLLSDWPDYTGKFYNQRLAADWAELLAVRSVSNKALELAREQKKLGKTQEAQVVLTFTDEALAATVSALGDELPALLMVSAAHVRSQQAQASRLRPSVAAGGSPLCGADVWATAHDDRFTAVVLPAEGTKCQRCWNFRTNVGADVRFPEVCVPCAEVLGTEPVSAG